MKVTDFLKAPKLTGNLFVCSGNEVYFQDQVRALFKKSFPEQKIEVVESDSDNFYEAVEPSSLFSEEKILFIDNSSGELKNQKHFEEQIKNSSSKYVVFGDYKTKEGFEIDCSKVKDSARDVNPFVQGMFKNIGVEFSSKDLPIFYFMYKNNLQRIWNEVRKIGLYNRHLKKTLLTGQDVQDILSVAPDKNIFRFSNNFMHRKLRGAINSLPEQQESLLHVSNIFSAAEKVFLAKKVPEQELFKNYKFNNYYYANSIQPIIELWSEQELKDLIVEMNSLRVKLKTFNYPIRLRLIESVYKYCR